MKTLLFVAVLAVTFAYNAITCPLLSAAAHTTTHHQPTVTEHTLISHNLSASTAIHCRLRLNP